jgi:hypothetical protein
MQENSNLSYEMQKLKEQNEKYAHESNGKHQYLEMVHKFILKGTVHGQYNPYLVEPDLKKRLEMFHKQELYSQHLDLLKKE